VWVYKVILVADGVISVISVISVSMQIGGTSTLWGPVNPLAAEDLQRGLCQHGAGRRCVTQKTSASLDCRHATRASPVRIKIREWSLRVDDGQTCASRGRHERTTPQQYARFRQISLGDVVVKQWAP
jgi:hypothetical protein